MGKGLETLAASSGFKGKAQWIDQRHKIKPSVLTVHVLYRVEPGNYLPLRDNIPKATTKHSGNRWWHYSSKKHRQERQSYLTNSLFLRVFSWLVRRPDRDSRRNQLKYFKLQNKRTAMYTHMYTHTRFSENSANLKSLLIFFYRLKRVKCNSYHRDRTNTDESIFSIYVS